MRAEQPQKMFNVAAKRVPIAVHENLTLLFSFLCVCCEHLYSFLVEFFFCLVEHNHIGLFLDVSVVLPYGMRMV